PTFLNYYFSHFIRFKQDISTSGSAYNALTIIKLKELRINLPPLEEQQEIVAKIEELLSELDKGKEQLETARQQLKVYRQAVLKWAFEGKLTNPEVKEGELPEGWKEKKLGSLLNFVGSGVTPKGGQSVYQTSGIPFLRSQNVYPNELRLDDVAFISDKIDERMKRTRVKPFDVLLNITGASIRRSTFIPASFVKGNVNQHVCILRADQQTLNCQYLSYYLNSTSAQAEIMNNQSGATRQGLNFQQVRSLAIPFPPIKEQIQIVQEIESRLSVCDKVEETITQSLQHAETLRQSILKKAFEGKLVNEPIYQSY
ncbi:restriction endonuclease subunit S, partial [Adhaeribacter aerolatus]|uniref:restriction endonuclease subunit S n=1 Tax=Adhaeribacter aerolatus TaxID=670289 RepID=UPI00158124CE